jgi:hypothetical protein
MIMGDAEALESASRRAAALAASWAERPDPDAPYHWSGPAGSVALRRVQAAVEGELVYVLVWVGADEDDLQGPAHFKIVNPPLIYVDPAGNWVEDPLMALAATITGMNRRTARKVKR